MAFSVNGGLTLKRKSMSQLVKWNQSAQSPLKPFRWIPTSGDASEPMSEVVPRPVPSSTKEEQQ